MTEKTSRAGEPGRDPGTFPTAAVNEASERTVTPDIDSPLPWRVVDTLMVSAAGDDDNPVAKCIIRDDAAYIVTACNAYPSLVKQREELLAAVARWMDSGPRFVVDPIEEAAAYRSLRALVATMKAEATHGR